MGNTAKRKLEKTYKIRYNLRKSIEALRKAIRGYETIIEFVEITKYRNISDNCESLEKKCWKLKLAYTVAKIADIKSQEILIKEEKDFKKSIIACDKTAGCAYHDVKGLKKKLEKAYRKYCSLHDLIRDTSGLLPVHHALVDHYNKLEKTYSDLELEYYLKQIKSEV